MTTVAVALKSACDCHKLPRSWPRYVRNCACVFTSELHPDGPGHCEGGERHCGKPSTSQDGVRVQQIATYTKEGEGRGRGWESQRRGGGRGGRGVGGGGYIISYTILTLSTF